ncbi:MAG: hypothetical protein IKP27_06275 [Paludibacteraceae bacterium]|nr:hypothetical protein [Paludibacteraceae bacterium]
MSLISEDVKELSLLCSGMAEMASVPASVLSLAKGKASSLLQRIEMLESCQKTEVSAHVVVEPVQSVAPVVEPVVSQPVLEERREEVKPVVVETRPVRESPKAVAREEKHLENVVEEVEYQSAKSPVSKGETVPARNSAGIPQGKRDVVVRPEVKNHVPDAGSVRTVLDANRSSRRVESRFVQSIKKAITLNDRIRYLNELFGGDADLMTSTIAALDAMDNLQEAKDYVKWNFSWDEADEAVSDFMRLLEDRFS